MSLTKTAKSFRQGVKILAIVMVVYYVAILFVIPTTREIILNLLVDRNPPNPKYGQLDTLTFVPAEIRSLNNVQPPIVLETTDGRLPAGLPKKMTVYKYEGVQYSYLAGQGAQADADKLGFSEAELISDLKGKEYSWRSLTTGGILYINTETNALLLATNIFGQQDEFVRGTLDQESAKEYAVNILKDLGRFDENIFKNEYHKVALGQFIGNVVVETRATADAQVAKVDLFAKMDNYPILGPDAKKGLISMTLKNPGQEISPFNYPQMEVYYWDLTSEKDASYPIITVQEAWKQVQAGKAVISSVRPRNFNPFIEIVTPTVDRILINSVYLGYYQTPDFQKFMQPIYVFEGTYTTGGTPGGDIVMYYPALTSEFTRAAPLVPARQSTSTPTSN